MFGTAGKMSGIARKMFVIEEKMSAIEGKIEEMPDFGQVNRDSEKAIRPDQKVVPVEGKALEEVILPGRKAGAVAAEDLRAVEDKNIRLYKLFG